jgi:hypothetical protein
VGTVTGTALISGLTYYYCKKKRTIKKDNLIIANSQNQEVEDDNLKTEVIETKERLTEDIGISREGVSEISEITTNQLATLTPPSSPLPQRGSQQLINLNHKELLLTQLRNKLFGNEQLWNDYLEVNQLLIANPTSNLILKHFNQIQDELLQFLTIGEITLLLENQTINQVRNPQTEYIQAIEEVRNPQMIRYSNPQY